MLTRRFAATLALAERGLSRLPAPLLFVGFCFLIASRDVLSKALMKHDVPAVFLLSVFMLSASLYAWLFRWFRTGSAAFAAPFARRSGVEKIRFVKLGLSTWVVYAATIFGIEKLGAQLFNAVDAGAIPLLTLLLAARTEPVSPRQKIGSLVSASGLALFLFATTRAGFPVDGGAAWILVCLLSAAFTSLCSLYQRQQVQEGMHADEVLLYRFPIPAAIMLVWLWIKGTPLSLNSMVPMLVVSFVCVFLPLWLLCIGLMRESLGRFSAYLFLIPVFTFVLGPMWARDESGVLNQTEIVLGVVLALVGYCVFEGILTRRTRSAPQPVRQAAKA